MTVRKDTAEVVVGCMNFRKCDFSPSKNREGLPVVFVDEQVYRELPSFLVATVDKFAMLPWRGETGMLFGRVLARDGRRFYGPLDKIPKSAERLSESLLPPELIVQDELHLISGPLGTMAGLYETAIEALCSRKDDDGELVLPKVLASTATVRRAREQVRRAFRENRAFDLPAAGGGRFRNVLCPGRPRVSGETLCGCRRAWPFHEGDSAADLRDTLVGG